MDLAISIHASAREATRAAIVSPDTISHFNPRFREGSDNLSKMFLSLFHYFNPRFREGSDNDTGGRLSPLLHFNPRFREGSD